MAERDREFAEFIRRSLHAAAESVMIGHNGLGQIHARLAAMRLAGAADPGEHRGLRAGVEVGSGRNAGLARSASPRRPHHGRAGRRLLECRASASRRVWRLGQTKIRRPRRRRIADSASVAAAPNTRRWYADCRFGAALCGAWLRAADPRAAAGSAWRQLPSPAMSQRGWRR
jgi:hypothetical protein